MYVKNEILKQQKMGEGHQDKIIPGNPHDCLNCAFDQEFSGHVHGNIALQPFK